MSAPEEASTETRHDDDAPLLARIAGGDRAAFQEIVIKYREAMVALVRRYVKTPSDAEDVTQRALLRAYEKLSTFRGESAFRTWLFRIAVHLALNHVRGLPRTVDVDLDDIAAFTSALDTGRLVAAEMWRKVSLRLDELPPKQRLSVELRLFHDLEFKEIGVLAECSEDAAKMSYHHGIKRLRDVLDVK